MNRLLLAIIAVWLYTLAALAQTADAASTSTAGVGE
jgi:hypothetical protein